MVKEYKAVGINTFLANSTAMSKKKKELNAVREGIVIIIAFIFILQVSATGKVCSAAGCMNNETTHILFAFPIIENIHSHGKIVEKVHLNR